MITSLKTQHDFIKYMENLRVNCNHHLKPAVTNMIIYYVNGKPVYADTKTDKVCGYCGKMFYKKEKE